MTRMMMIGMATAIAGSYDPEEAVTGGDHSSKKMPCLSHGKTKLNPGPRKKQPMMTSTAHIIRNIDIIVMANLRSSGLCDGFLSMYGVIAITPSAMPGINTPATDGLNIFRSSCRPRKYHGAFDGFGVAFTSAKPSSGAFT